MNRNVSTGIVDYTSQKLLVEKSIHLTSECTNFKTPKILKRTKRTRGPYLGGPVWSQELASVIPSNTGYSVILYTLKVKCVQNLDGRTNGTNEGGGGGGRRGAVQEERDSPQ